MERSAILVQSDKAGWERVICPSVLHEARVGQTGPESDNYGHNHDDVSTTLLSETREIDFEDTTRERVT